MVFEVVWSEDEAEAWDVAYPYFLGQERPRSVVMGSQSFVGMEMAAEDLEKRFIPIKGTDVYVPARESFYAAGGELPYDIAFVVGFDGIESPLEEVRYSRRPDGGEPVTATKIRTVRLDPLVNQAIGEHRTAYRRQSETLIVRVSPAERQTVYLAAMERSRGESRRRIGDEDLKRTADVYMRALAERSNPTKAVQDQLRLPNRNVAKKWVQRARKAGYLSPAPTERRAGAI